MCDAYARPIARRLRDERRKRLENRANLEDTRRGTRGERAERAKQIGQEEKKEDEASLLEKAHRHGKGHPEFVRVFGRLKRSRGPSAAYICWPCPADRPFLSKCRVFSPETPCRSTPIDSARRRVT